MPRFSLAETVASELESRILLRCQMNRSETVSPSVISCIVGCWDSWHGLQLKNRRTSFDDDWWKRREPNLRGRRSLDLRV